jgi:hypothetical protein
VATPTPTGTGVATPTPTGTGAATPTPTGTGVATPTPISAHDQHLQKLLEVRKRLEEFGECDNEEDEEERQKSLEIINAKIDEFSSAEHATDTLDQEELQGLDSLMKEYDLGEDEPDAVDDGRLVFDIGASDGESSQPIRTPAPQGFDDVMWGALKASAHEERFGAMPLLDFTNMRSWHDFGNMGLQSSRNWKTDADPENTAQEKFNLSWTTKISNQTDRVEVSRDKEA